MLMKSLIIFLFVSNPLFFLVNQSGIGRLNLQDSPSFNFDSFDQQLGEWNRWRESLVSSLWFNNPNFLPIRDWGIDEPEVEAKAALIFNNTKDKILYQKNINRVLPIASLTKLMTAIIVLENVALDEITTVSEEAIAGYGEMGDLVVNEKISVRNLLYALLMESSNDAAIALAQFVQEKTAKDFVELMSQKAEELKLENTRFTGPTGYEPSNVSTVNEIRQLVNYSFKYPFIWDILKTPTITLSSVDGKINHYWVNTDALLNRLPNIVGGKTGYTEEAEGCLVLAVEQPSDEILITVVLGAKERFLQTEKLINWVQRAYQW
jgi:D-alanyl-D-alanine carboxypeptidase (penicillin-binding protein 5/6)